MKKIYQSKSQKLKVKNNSHRELKKKGRSKYNITLEYKPNLLDIYNKGARAHGEVIVAPEKFRITTEVEESLVFFKRMRQKRFMSQFDDLKFMEISLRDVVKINYATISVLIAMIDNLKAQDILTRVQLPENEEASSYIRESGLLNDMYNEEGKRFKKSKMASHLFFEKGSGRLTKHDNIRISDSVREIVKHLTGTPGHCSRVRRVLLEICGNAIEWSGSKDRQWLLGVKYEDERVIVTVTDVGKGILATLFRKFDRKLSDFFGGKTNSQILQGAFERKYGSSSQEVNRNKGLPSVKYCYDDGRILDLKVITNDVILNFDGDNISRPTKKGHSFYGTLYRWVINKDCLTK